MVAEHRAALLLPSSLSSAGGAPLLLTCAPLRRERVAVSPRVCGIASVRVRAARLFNRVLGVVVGVDVPCVS